MASNSQADLGQGIVGSSQDAGRVAEVMRLLPMVLLREDPRVQAEYQVWWGRMLAGDQAPIDEAAIASAVFEDFLQLRSLVQQLGLTRYRSWLPQMLRWEFQRFAEQKESAQPHAIEITLPDVPAWASNNARAPKRGQTHREDHERYVTWFYRREVKQPADSWNALEREYIRTRSQAGVTIRSAENTVKNGVKRAKQLLAVIS
jgi:hypothetical protein